MGSPSAPSRAWLFQKGWHIAFLSCFSQTQGNSTCFTCLEGMALGIRDASALSESAQEGAGEA